MVSSRWEALVQISFQVLSSAAPMEIKVLQTYKKFSAGSWSPLFCWESETRKGKRRLTIGSSAVVLVLGIVALLTGQIAAGTVLGVGAGLKGLVDRFVRGRL